MVLLRANPMPIVETRVVEGRPVVAMEGNTFGLLSNLFGDVEPCISPSEGGFTEVHSGCVVARLLWVLDPYVLMVICRCSFLKGGYGVRNGGKKRSE